MPALRANTPMGSFYQRDNLTVIWRSGGDLLS
jgi:hypothetical protein